MRPDFSRVVWRGGRRGSRTCHAYTAENRFGAGEQSVGECEKAEETYLALLRCRCFFLRVDADVMEAVRGPAQGGAMEVCEPSTLHFVPNYGDQFWPASRVLVESSNGKQKVLKGIQSVVFRGRAEERGRLGRQYSRMTCESQVRLGFRSGRVLSRLATEGRENYTLTARQENIVLTH